MKQVTFTEPVEKVNPYNSDLKYLEATVSKGVFDWKFRINLNKDGSVDYPFEVRKTKNGGERVSPIQCSFMGKYFRDFAEAAQNYKSIRNEVLEIGACIEEREILASLPVKEKYDWEV